MRYGIVMLIILLLGLSACSTTTVDEPKSSDYTGINRFIYIPYSSYRPDIDERVDTINNYDLAILHTFHDSYISQYKADNPSLETYMYLEIGPRDQSDPDGDAILMRVLSSQIGNSQWFIYDEHGRFFKSVFWMNPSNKDWQKFYVKEALEDLRKADFDGLFIDDFRLSIGKNLHIIDDGGNRRPLSDEEFRAGMLDFLDFVSTELGKEGFEVVVNVGQLSDNDVRKSFVKETVQRSAGVMEEAFANKELDWQPYSENLWRQQINFYNDFPDEKKLFLASVSDGQRKEENARFSYASFLLIADDNVHFYSNEGIYAYPGKEWSFFFEELGQAKNSYQEKDGYFYREFANGTVMVNPSETVRKEVILSGNYEDLQGNRVQNIVFLEPESAKIILSVS